MGVHLATVPRDWIRGVSERYVAGSDTRGRQEGRFNYHDQQGSKKHGRCFVGCDDYFYGLGLLAKYDKKP